MKKINVLSLFDGICSGRVALQRAGIPVNKYYASEIDKYALMITKKNFPDNVQLGDVTKWKNWNLDWGSIDLLIGGSPCVSWSVAGKQLGAKDPRGQLLFDYVNILHHIQKYNPNVKFLVENVKMKQEFQDIFSNMLGVQPVEINSALVSAQNRRRLYWANWEFGQPEDRHIMLKDIVHEYSKVDCDKTICLNEYIVPFDKTLQILEKEVERGKVGYFGKDSQANRVYYIHDKAVTLCGSAGGGAAKMGQYLFGCITPDRVNKRQNGQRFNEGHKFYTLTVQDRHGVLVEGYIRKLTPVECERLQTLESGFTANGIDSKTGKVVPISSTQRYKALGNGWTVDIIAHILKNIDFDK